MVELPLFPLNTVLFPDMQLKLHIFEERYKIMINECYENKKPFGVVLIESGQEALGPVAKPYDIGCTAEITQLQKLPFGRMNIVTQGGQRFRINQIKQEYPYLLGDVEFISLHDDDPKIINTLTSKLRPLVMRYTRILSEVGEMQFDLSQIPKDAQSLAHIAASLLQSESKQKQKLLEVETTSGLLSELMGIYRLETVLLEVRSSPPDESFDIGPFSSN